MTLTDYGLSLLGRPGVLGPMAALIAAGKLIDSFLRDRTKAKISANLQKTESFLSKLPLEEWQRALAEIGALGLVVASIVACVLLPVLVAVPLSLMAAAVSKVNLADSALWPVTLLLIPIIFFALAGVVLFTCDLAETRLSRYLTNQDLLLGGTVVSFASVVFTGISCIISAKFFSTGTGAFWFDGSGWPDQGNVFALAGLKFLFDAVTVISVLISLRAMASSRRWFFALAAANIGVAASAAIALRFLLDMVSGPSLTWSDHVKTSALWLLKVASLRLNPSDPDWQLTPVLLATFAPVSMYMLTLLLLCALKPISAAIRHLCGLLSEKKNSPFLELGTILALILGFAKVLTDWPWMIRVVSHLPF